MSRKKSDISVCGAPFVDLRAWHGGRRVEIWRMKYGCLAMLVALAAACAPMQEGRENPAPTANSGIPAAIRASPETKLPAQIENHFPQAALADPPPELLRATRWTCSGVVFEGISFDDRTHRLRVVDQAGGPGSEYPDAPSAATSHGGLAAVNAGFFTPEGDPLGWVIAAGKPSGTWNSASSLGNGIWHQGSDGRSAISRRESLGRQQAATMRELLQAGPMLVEGGRLVNGLEATKSSIRTVIAWDGGHRWWMGQSSPCTLQTLATCLDQQGPGGWMVRDALNLDGGRSADLWVSARVTGGPLACRMPWNRPVRNFLVLVPR